MKKKMLNRWIRIIVILFGVMNLVHCIHCMCVGKWEVACCEFTTATLLFLLALYDWTMEKELSATRRKWFRNGWIQCQSTMDSKLLSRYRLLLDKEQSTTSPRVDELNIIRCRTLISLWASLRNRLINDNFEHYDYEGKNSTEDS